MADVLRSCQGHNKTAGRGEVVTLQGFLDMVQIHIEGTRISLDSVVYSFLNGESPESIAQNIPLLSLGQVYGGIAFYLANRELVDAYLKKGEAEFQRLQQSCREKSPLLYQKLKAAQSQK